MNTFPKTCCPFCGDSDFSIFHVLSGLNNIEQFRLYQEGEMGVLTSDGADEPFMVCHHCDGLFRRDNIDHCNLHANYQDRSADRDRAQIRRAIDEEFARVDANPGNKYVHEAQFIDRFIEPTRVGQRTRALDIGSREGVLARMLRDRGMDVTVIEPTQAYCDVLAAEHDLEVVCGLFPHAGIAEDTFDLITALEVLHRVDDLFGFVRAANSVLRQGGRLMLNVNNIYRLGLNYLTQQHRAIFSPSSVRTLLGRGGFTPLMVEAVEYSPTGGLRVMAEKTGQPRKAVLISSRDPLFRLRTHLLRAEFGLVGPRAWRRNELLDGIALRALKAVRLSRQTTAGRKQDQTQ